MDQSQRATPHGFSQLATSFLAYPRLGIPRAPLLRLAGVHFQMHHSQTSMYAHLFVEPFQVHLIGARFSSTPAGQTAGVLLNLSKPKLSKIAVCSRRN